jgi:hypothetical protein
VNIRRKHDTGHLTTIQAQSSDDQYWESIGVVFMGQFAIRIAHGAMFRTKVRRHVELRGPSYMSSVH